MHMEMKQYSSVCSIQKQYRKTWIICKLTNQLAEYRQSLKRAKNSIEIPIYTIALGRARESQHCIDSIKMLQIHMCVRAVQLLCNSMRNCGQFAKYVAPKGRQINLSCLASYTWCFFSLPPHPVPASLSPTDSSFSHRRTKRLWR